MYLKPYQLQGPPLGRHAASGGQERNSSGAWAMKCAACAAATRAGSVSFSLRNAARRSTAGFARLVERAGEAARLGIKCHPRCATPVVSRWPTGATIRGPFRLISATPTFSTRCGTPNWHQVALRISGSSTASIASRGAAALAASAPRRALEPGRDPAARRNPKTEIVSQGSPVSFTRTPPTIKLSARYLPDAPVPNFVVDYPDLV